MSRKSLKEQNLSIIRSYVGGVVTLYLLLIALGNLADLRDVVSLRVPLDETWRWLIPPLSAALYLFLVRLVPTEWKEVLVFWRFRNRLPGHQAFSKEAGDEPRVNLERLEQLHGPLPSDPRKQNELWFSIYQNHKDALEVLDPHKSYLLYRELTYLNLAVGLVLILPSAVVGLLALKMSLVLLVLVVLASILLSLNAQSSAKRFIQNVLAIESAGTRDGP